MDHDYCTIRWEAVPAEPGGIRAVRLVLGGELDFGASGDLRDALLGLAADGRWASIVADLDAVHFIDSEALGALLDGCLAARGAGLDFRAVNAHGVVRRVLTVTGMLSVLDPAAGHSGAGRS